MRTKRVLRSAGSCTSVLLKMVTTSPGCKHQVVGGVFLQDGFAQVKGNELYAQVFGVEALYTA
jgi:hypothetical protein